MIFEKNHRRNVAANDGESLDKNPKATDKVQLYRLLLENAADFEQVILSNSCDKVGKWPFKINDIVVDQRANDSYQKSGLLYNEVLLLT